MCFTKQTINSKLHLKPTNSVHDMFQNTGLELFLILTYHKYLSQNLMYILLVWGHLILFFRRKRIAAGGMGICLS